MKSESLTLIAFIILIGACGCSEKAGDKNLLNAKSREDKWMEDLNFFRTEYLSTCKSFPEDSLTNCIKRIDSLQTNIASLTDNQIMMEIARCIAMANDAHTSIYLGSSVRRMPIRFYWFSDGLYVVKTLKGYEKYLGAEVISICDKDVYAILSYLNKYIPGKDNWVKYKSAFYLSSPDVLEGIGLTMIAELAFKQFFHGGITEDFSGRM